MSNIHSAATCGNTPPLDGSGAEHDRQGSSLDIIAAEIEAEHQATYRAARAAVEHAMRCGELLLDAKTKVGHGEWLPWLEANTSIGIRQAQNYMRIAKNRLKIEAVNANRVAHLPIREAAALLAEPDPHFARAIAAHSEALRETTRELVVHLNEVRQAFAGDDNAFSQWLASEFGAEADESYIDLADVGDILEALR